MRPIVWGFIISCVGGFFWLLFSVTFGVIFGLTGEPVPLYYRALVYISGLAMYLGLPIAVIIELILYIRRKRSKARAYIS